MVGTKKAKVFPLPVTASAATSLPASMRGTAEACTAVMRGKPRRDSNVSSVPWDKDKVDQAGPEAVVILTD